MNAHSRKPLVALFAALFMAAGCTRPVPEIRAEPAASATRDPWVLEWTHPSDSTPALLWNGLVGVRLSRLGTGCDVSGASLPSFVIDGYDPNDIRKQPNPLALAWSVGGTPIRPTGSYRQALDLRTGVLSTSFSDGSAEFLCETAIDPEERAIAQRWSIRSDRDPGILISLIDEQGATSRKLTTAQLAESVITLPHTSRLRIAETVEGGTVRWQDRGSSRAFDCFMEIGQTLVYQRVATWGLGETSAPAPRPKGIVRGKADSKFWEAPPPRSFADIRARSERAWARRWQTDIEIDGPVEDQQAVRSMLFYLRSAINPGADMSISPFGLSSSRYKGHVFWDADTWVFPALCFVEPEKAAAIVSYRFNRLNAARQNFQRSFKVDDGIQFPWESSVSGLEVAPEPMRRHLQITGDVARTALIAAELGLVKAHENGESGLARASGLVTDSTALWLYSLERPPGGKCEIKNVLGPDEYKKVDNDLYTNLLAQFAFRSGDWHAKSDFEFKLPRDSQSLLTYDGDALQGYQQASAVLAIYPLQFPEAEKQAKTMMERFPPKTSPNGPSMTESVHATIWARLGNTDRAYAEWRNSWREFTNRPLMAFAETRTGKETYFTTGAAGCLQSVLYGFLGFRIDSKVDQGAVWSHKLRGESWLSIKPRLPQAWKKVQFRNFILLGKRYTLTVTPDGAKITEGDS